METDDAMKKLLDGVICAFHVHNGLKEEEVANWLAVKIHFNINELKTLLQNDFANILGRSVFNLRMDSIICNPADGSCVFVKIKCVPTACVNYLISGELFQVESR